MTETSPSTDPTADMLAAYASRLRYEDLTAEAVREAKRRVIDSFAIAFAGYDEDPSRIAREIALGAIGSPGATVLGTGHRSTPELAALANGTMVHSQDFMDTYLSRESLHPSDTISAVLAAAECAGAGGRDLILAIVLAYEAMCRLADCANVRERGWDHVVFGCISSALGAAKVLGLNEAQTKQALGLAAVCNTALRQTRVGEVPMWKALAPSNAQRNGLFAARLAQRGMTGPVQAFCGLKGFENQVSGPLELAALGSRETGYLINQTYIKVWPVQYNTQGALQAALALRKRIPDPGRIESIGIDIAETGRILSADTPAKWDPQTRETADHSLPYIAVAALLDGQVNRATFDEVNFRDPEKLALVRKTVVRADPEFTASYPVRLNVRLTVRMPDGQEETESVDVPKGHALDPLSDAEVEEKFRRLCSGRLSSAQIEECLNRLWRLEDQLSLDRLMQDLAIAPDPGRNR